MPDPFGPVIATRSPRSSCRSTGPRVNAPVGPDRRTTAARATATTSPDRGACAIENCSCHSLRGSSTTSSRSIIRCVWRALAACFSEVACWWNRMFLSFSLRRANLLLAARTPLSIHSRCIRARASRVRRRAAYSSKASRACRRVIDRSSR